MNLNLHLSLSNDFSSRHFDARKLSESRSPTVKTRKKNTGGVERLINRGVQGWGGEADNPGRPVDLNRGVSHWALGMPA